MCPVCGVPAACVLYNSEILVVRSSVTVWIRLDRSVNEDPEEPIQAPQESAPVYRIGTDCIYRLLLSVESVPVPLQVWNPHRMQ